MSTQNALTLSLIVIVLLLLVRVESSVPADVTKSNIDRFTTWARELGLRTSNTEIRYDEHFGYGVYSNRIISSAESVMEIPESLVLNRKRLTEICNQVLSPEDENFARDKQLRNHLAKALSNINTQSNGTNTDAHILSFFILYHKFFPDVLPLQPWIELLPEKMHTPLFYSEEELEELRGSQVFEKTVLLKEQTLSFWKSTVVPEVNRIRNSIWSQIGKFQKDLTEHDFNSQWDEGFSLSQWRWAMSIVSSRAALVPKQGLAICMGADIFNHKSLLNTRAPKKIFNETTGSFHVIAQQTYGIGTQIFLDYGKMPSSDLLQLYGFIEEGNQAHESVSFYFSIPENDPLRGDKIDLLTKLNYKSELYLSLTHKPSKELMFYLRLMMANDVEIYDFQLRPMDMFHSAVSQRNEISALYYLGSIADTLVNAYPTTLEEDDSIVKNAGLSKYSRMAIDVRMREKKVLLRLLSYCSAAFQQMHKEYEGSRPKDATVLSGEVTAEELQGDNTRPIPIEKTSSPKETNANTPVDAQLKGEALESVQDDLPL